MVNRVHQSTDPVLHHFLVARSRYNIGGYQEPIAIRDQMLRACLLIERIHAAGLLTPNHRLAVVGAGAAGATVALRAARDYHIPTVLFDAASQPLVTHPYTCATRWVDPTLYDWPAPHWSYGQFPLPNTPLPPLDWVANAASLVGSRWRRLWLARTTSLFAQRLLTFQPLTTITNCREENNLLYLESSSSDIPEDRQGPFDIVIAACGRGRERTWLGRQDEPTGYTGYHFWQNDKLGDKSYGLSDAILNYVHTIVISGGGDGAIQDLLRISFRPKNGRPAPLYPGEILQDIRESVVNVTDNATWESLCWRIAAAEDKASRARAWVAHNGQRYDDTQDAQILRELNQEYRDAIQMLLDDGILSGAVEDALSVWYRPDLAQVHFVSRQDFCFSWCYPVNRFLGSLLLVLAERQSGRRGESTPPFQLQPAWTAGSINFWIGASVAALEPRDHQVCTPEECRNKLHDVTLEHRNGQPIVIQSVDMILIRHGLVPPPEIAGIPNVALARQSLPYALLG